MTFDLYKPQVMGILNVTPDSFSDGGAFNSLDNALKQTEQMIADGASIIDIGGESTRPGAEDVAEAEELSRVIPVIEAIRQRFDVPISIDTTKAKVMTEAVAAGASMINDVCALQEPGALQAAAKANVPVCLMHMQGTPRTMQVEPSYGDVADEVNEFLRARAQTCIEAGIAKDHIVLDPGFGFGKTLPHNLSLLAQVEALVELGYPVLIGLSRKSMFGKLLDRDVDDRLAASLAGMMVTLNQGAHIFRVHDVKETMDCLRVWQAVKEQKA
ncbi:dihydropteroate synthase [Neiella marina]|uniref:Dihydropteroate synthase n=1 Tax=Neiella holothuriorum TaxID=2870530 RepID=A0ABS7EGC6_9GAMM|nr:dihydropteroate synthase [Neiella holothuriorum]MBW8190988.1 dihydropteroate synthase [Neiella holothuriorum]